MSINKSQQPPSNPPPRREQSPLETYEQEQAQRREAAMERIRDLWASFLACQGIVLTMLCIGVASMPELTIIGGILLAVAGGVFFLSWMTALKLAVFAIQNQELLRRRTIITAFLPALIVPNEVVMILSIMPPQWRLW